MRGGIIRYFPPGARGGRSAANAELTESNEMLTRQLGEARSPPQHAAAPSVGLDVAGAARRH